jgi:homoserine dehydrogenase
LLLEALLWNQQQRRHIAHVLTNKTKRNKTIKKGVLSGTLSYVFNTYKRSGPPFSAVVAGARDAGYTEPDPREDLSGVCAVCVCVLGVVCWRLCH